jgi:hypothetical protein
MVSWGLGLALETVTGALHIEYLTLSKIQDGLLLFYIIQFFTFYANLLIKASMCVMLLRILQTTLWRIGLWVMLATLIGIAIATTITNVAECSPPSAYWHLEQHFESCWNNTIVTNIGLGFYCTFDHVFPGAKPILTI